MLALSVPLLGSLLPTSPPKIISWASSWLHGGVFANVDLTMSLLLCWCWLLRWLCPCCTGIVAHIALVLLLSFHCMNVIANIDCTLLPALHWRCCPCHICGFCQHCLGVIAILVLTLLPLADLCQHSMGVITIILLVSSPFCMGVIAFVALALSPLMHWCLCHC
jgi:hypothetical protein